MDMDKLKIWTTGYTRRCDTDLTKSGLMSSYPGLAPALSEAQILTTSSRSVGLKKSECQLCLPVTTNVCSSHVVSISFEETDFGKSYFNSAPTHCAAVPFPCTKREWFEQGNVIRAFPPFKNGMQI